MVTKKLFDRIIAQYAQDAHGRHGLAHWARVLENGRRLVSLNGARIQVVELFAVFHDSCRVTEKGDPGHGQRGADLAVSLRGKYFDLSDGDFDLLYDACVRHTDGETQADITVQTCWDSDRLDLGRVNIMPSPEKLCTDAAKEKTTLDWAIKRSVENVEPLLIRDEWGVSNYFKN
jgi:uncharacterized protein